MVMYDFAPIEQCVARSRPELETDLEIATYLGISRGLLYRHRRNGISPLVADRLCIIGLGIHPVHLYPSWGKVEVAA